MCSYEHRELASIPLALSIYPYEVGSSSVGTFVPLVPEFWWFRESGLGNPREALCRARASQHWDWLAVAAVMIGLMSNQKVASQCMRCKLL